MVPPFPSWAHSGPAHPTHRKQPPADQPKKPRHRHSAFQLAALNELYDRDDHPSLEDRTALAERLGMETKTVNSWFQNKRASSKKRHKGPSAAANQYELPPISALLASVSAPPTHPASPREYDELSEDDYDEPYHPSHHHSISSGTRSAQQSAHFYPESQHDKHFFDSETDIMPVSARSKARSRPTPAQTEELKGLYHVNSHPSKEEREALGKKIGMRYQSVTNWFQNQRSIAKKRKEDEEYKAATSAPPSHSFAAFPPASGLAHPSLSVPPPTSHPSLSTFLAPPRARRSPSAAPSGSTPRSSPYPRRNIHHERVGETPLKRPRRTRPEPYQLEALKALYRKNHNPSIEDRQLLAADVGMDIGKVTNWFRNMRQTNRRQARKGGNAEDADYDMDDESASVMGMEEDESSIAPTTDSRFVSRTATPSIPSPMDDERSIRLDGMRMKVEAKEDHRAHLHAQVHPLHHRPMYSHASHSGSHSELGSDEDPSQEAVTPSPSPESSPPPPPSRKARDHASSMLAVDPLLYAQFDEKTGVKYEDAMLLLTFHHGGLAH